MTDYDAFREQVMEWTRRELQTDPAATAEELYPKAVERFPSLSDLSVRLYRVRYVVKAGRELAREDLEAARESRRVSLPGSKSEPDQREMFAAEHGGRK